MNAKEELEKILLNEADVEGECENLIRLHSMAEKVTAAMKGEAVSGGSRNNDPMGTFMENKEKLLCKINRLQKEYEQHRDFVSGFVKCLQRPVYKKVLYGVYFNGKKLTAVADEIGYSYRHTQDLQDIAIQELQKIMDQSESSHKISYPKFDISIISKYQKAPDRVGWVLFSLEQN